MLATKLMPGASVFPRMSWHWESETDILSGAYRTAARGDRAETAEVSSSDGAVVVLDVVAGEICGVDVVIWPEVETVAALRAPAPQVAGRVILPASESGIHQVETDLAVTVDGLEQTFHLRIGAEREVTVVQVADHLLIELDEDDRLAGFWLTGVPPFPAAE